MRIFTTLAVCGFAALLPAKELGPNVIVILADDQGWGDLSIHGNQNLQTPHLDRLAAEGAQFKNFYVQPVCSPTRAEFLTGRYYPRGGVYNTGGGGERLDADEETIADIFKARGYATGAFGKWHNGTQAPYHPLNRGFDEFYGFTSGHWGSYFDAMVDHNGEIETSKGYLPNALTTKTIEFITENTKRSNPFFAYLAFPTPHSPMQTTDEAWERFDGEKLNSLYHGSESENLDHTRAALAMVENIDTNVGRVLKHIQELDIDENTIILYFTDNGPNGWRWNGGMRGKKSSTDEGGVRSPLFIRWPNRIPAGISIEQIAGSIDILPTLGSMVGLTWKPKQELDGIDLSNTLKSGKAASIDRTLVSHWGGRSSIRNQRFRLDDKGRLYDIEADRGQQIPVTGSQADIATKLSALLEEWKATTLVGHKSRRPLSIGYPGISITQLPARDASWTGEIKRSNRWPNCSYLANWTNTNDFIYWDAVIAESGEYKASILYTCAKENVGVALELSDGIHSVQTNVTVAHNPPVYGMEHDRTIREESYVKDFKTLELGVIELTSGSAKLKLSATEIPGSEAIEFRLLLLERLTAQRDGL